MKNPILPLLGLIFTLGAAATTTTRAASIYVDFGPNATVADTFTWNTVTTYTVGEKVADLRTTTNASTGYALTFTTVPSTGTGTVADGATTLTPAGNYRDAFYGALAGTPDSPTVITLSGLDPSITYSFSFYATVNRTGTRGTRHTLSNGTTSSFSELETINNQSTWSTPISGTPDPSGNLTITLTRASFNADQSYLLGVMRVDYIPEPSAALLTAAGLIPLLTRRRRR